MFTWNSYIAPWVYTLFFLVYAATIISCIVVVLSEKRNPIRSLAWVIALVFLPYVGWIFYIFFGRSIRNTRMISRRKKRKLLRAEPMIKTQADPADAVLSRESRQNIQLAKSLSGARYYPGNTVKLFTDGRSKF